MGTYIFRILAVFACCGVLCFPGGSAMGQVRKSTGVTIRTPASLGRVGMGTNASFLRSSAGGGGLQNAGGGYRGQGVLSSSMGRGLGQGRRMSASLDANRGIKGGGRALTSGISTVSGGLIGSAGGGALRSVSPTVGDVRKGASLAGGESFELQAAGGKGMADAILGRGMSLAAARGFLASVGQSGSLEEGDDAIRTLVPDHPGQYRDLMHKGEELLKAGSYMSGYDNFKLASDVVGRCPEPYLNMAHAKLGMGGYGMTAYYIRRALVCMPSLPQLPLRPKSFYSNVAVFGDLVIRLETYLDSNPGDGDALLILAYFRWFADNQDVPKVKELLARALAAAKSEGRTEAIQIFWRAIVASNKASGELKPATASRGAGGTTRPSEPALDKTENTPKVSGGSTGPQPR